MVKSTKLDEDNSLVQTPPEVSVVSLLLFELNRGILSVKIETHKDVSFSLKRYIYIYVFEIEIFKCGNITKIQKNFVKKRKIFWNLRKKNFPLKYRNSTGVLIASNNRILTEIMLLLFDCGNETTFDTT